MEDAQLAEVVCLEVVGVAAHSHAVAADVPDIQRPEPGCPWRTCTARTRCHTVAAMPTPPLLPDSRRLKTHRVARHRNQQQRPSRDCRKPPQ